MQNKAQYDLDRKAAKTSSLSSNNLDKYEYLTGEDLGLKPSTVEQAKFEYSPLDKVFTKGLNKDEDKKEGLLKRLKNIENAQKKLNISDDNREYFTPRSQVDSKYDEDENEDKDEDEDENEKTKCNFYQDSIEGMEGLELPDET